MLFLALVVGLGCGVIAAGYEYVLDIVIERTWLGLAPQLARALEPYGVPPWLVVPCICTAFGGVVGALIHLLGEPLANLPGVVMAAHRDGLLDHEEAPAMAAISIVSIAGAGSLGPEAPLIAIGGGLASFLSLYVDLSEAETLFVTMCGMGAGLAAFFGEPIGGALFACEVLHRHGLEYYEAVVPTVVAGLACNWSFRILSNLPQEAIWTFAAEEPLEPWTSVLGLVWGVLGGGLGWCWMRGTRFLRSRVVAPCGLGPRHIVKGLLGGLLIGSIGAIHPETLFWGEFEAQRIISRGEAPLPHAWPTVGALGAYSLEEPLVLLSIGLFKLLAISITVLAGHRGGFIFPFMFAGLSIGSAVAIAANATRGPLHDLLSPAAAALSCACAINVACTRTVLATPIVLSALSGRPDMLPTLLVASLTALYVAGDETVIVAARKRWLRTELDGCEILEDPTPPMARSRPRVRPSRISTPGAGGAAAPSWVNPCLL